MRQNTLEIEDGTHSYALTFSDRDFSLLGGHPTFLKHGVEFIKMLGVYENTSVAMDMKIPPGSKVVRKRGRLQFWTQMLLHEIEECDDLLSFDYSFRLSKGEDKHRLKGQLTGFRVRGLAAQVDAQPRGFCTLTLSEISPKNHLRAVEIIDVRSRTEVETDDKGLLRIYRTPASHGWPSALSGLLEFLKSSKEDEVTVHHN